MLIRYQVHSEILLLLRFISAETRLILAVKSLMLLLFEGFFCLDNSSSASSTSISWLEFLFSRDDRFDFFSGLEGVTIGVGKGWPVVDVKRGIMDADAVAFEVCEGSAGARFGLCMNAPGGSRCFGNVFLTIGWLVVGSLRLKLSRSDVAERGMGGGGPDFRAEASLSSSV